MMLLVIQVEFVLVQDHHKFKTFETQEVININLVFRKRVQVAHNLTFIHQIINFNLEMSHKEIFNMTRKEYQESLLSTMMI
jgi:hypothetical protein